MREVPGAPRGPDVEELRSSQDEQDGSGVSDPRREVVEKVQLALVRPVHVLENEHRWLLQGETLQQPPRCEEEIGAVPGRCVDTQAEQQREVSNDVGRLVCRDELGDGPVEFLTGQAGRVAFEDPRNLPDLFGERAVSDSFVVGKASPPNRSAALAFDEGDHLSRQPRLPDPRRPHDGEEMSSPLPHRPLPDRLEERHLVLPPDEGSGRHRALGR